MTLCITWIRKTSKGEELVFASDSRLRGYGAWDANPKLFLLERTDCAISFAGETYFSYPMITQIQNAVRSYPFSQSRFQDLTDFKGHLLNKINYMLEFKTDYEIPEVKFILGGYSWEKRKFYIWKIYYNKPMKEFYAGRVNTWKGLKCDRKISIMGDYTGEYMTKLKDKLDQNNKLVSGDFDMEPFETLVDMLKSKDEKDAIGGPPQLLKVYQHMNSVPIAVKWENNGDEFMSLLGRPLQSYEKMIYPWIDTDSMVIHKGTNLG